MRKPLKQLFTGLLLLTVLSPATAQERVLLARFEVTRDAFGTMPPINIDSPSPVNPPSTGSLNVKPPRPRCALFFYLKGNEVEGERIEGDKKTEIGLGSFTSFRLVASLKKLHLPKIDYQKHFDKLAKQPARKGKDVWTTADGSEVEVEINITGTAVRFKMWNPDVFFYNHDDDEAAVAVNEAVNDFILALGKSKVYF